MATFDYEVFSDDFQKWLIFSIKKYTQEEALDIFEQEYGYRPKENKVKVEKVRFYRRHEQLDIEEFPNGAYIFTDDCERGSFGTWCIEINR